MASTKHNIRFVGSLIACAAAALLAGNSPARAQSDWRDKSLHDEAAASAAVDAESDQETGDESGDDHEVKLSYYSTPWSKVLDKVAKQSGSTLVMQSVPPGKYSRHDRTKYSRKEAVRILNQDLEKEGFRILEKDKFLIVLHLSALRKQYARPELPPDAETAAAIIAQRKAANTERITHADARRKPKLEFDEDTAHHDSPIRLAAGDEEELGAPDEQPKAAAEEPATPKSVTSTVVKAKNKPARDLAQAVFRAFKTRAESIDKGSHGLPAFRAYRPATAADAAGRDKPITEEVARDVNDVLFTVEVDADKQEVIIEAPAAVARDLAGLIRALDIPRDNAEDRIEIIPAPERTQRIARNLQPNVARLVAQRQQEGNALAQAQAAPQQDNAPANQQPKNVQGMVGGIQGDVRVESMEDLGVIIIEGSEHDVGLMMEVIREIEKLSLAAVPEIELKMLKHVNSESLATLLTSVYEKLTAQAGQGGPAKQLVSIFPVVKPNAILILAPADDIKGIIGVVDKLDQPVDAQTEFQIFPLKSANSPQLAAMIVEFYEQRGGLGARIKVVADVRTNSVIVQARPADLAEVGALILKLDRDASSSVAQMRIFPIKHASAEELADVINRAILNALNPASNATGPSTSTGQQPGAGPAPRGQGGGAGGEAAQQLQQPKSIVLEFLAPSGDASKLVRSGILSDVRVTADPRINSIVVTAPQQSMQLMAALIAQLDQPASTESLIKIFPLVNSDADKMVSVLQQVFGLTQQNQQNAAGGNTPPVSTSIDDAVSTVVPLRFSVEARTNSIIAIGSANAMLTVEAIILRLDQADSRGRKVEVVKLKNSPAGDVAEAINNFLTSQRDLAQLDPNFVSTTELLEREIIAVPEAVTNSLLVSVTPRYYDEIMKMIARLDEAPAQVIVQALLVEVELQNTDEFGVELGFQDSVLFDRSISSVSDITTITNTIANPGTGFSTEQQNIISRQAQPGFIFNNNGLPLGNNVTGNTSTVGTQGIGNLGVGRVNGDLGFGGLVLSASSENVSALLRALSSQRKIQVLSRPQIQTLDNQEATIQVGQQVPVVNSVVPGQTYVIPDIRQQQVGIILTVVPRISPDDSIIMRAEATKSELSGQGVPIFFDAVNNQQIESPIINITQALATVSVTSGQTIVLGGMITKSDNSLERKVPWLGDIPILGRAFRYDSTTSRRTELLIFLTPRIVKTDFDSELIKQVEAERLHFIEEEAEQIHGPLYGIPTAPPEQRTPEWQETPAIPTVPTLPNGQPVVPEGQPAAPPQQLPPVPPQPGPMTSNHDPVPTSVVPQRMESIRVIDQASATQSQVVPQSGNAVQQAAHTDEKAKPKSRILSGIKSK